MVFETRGFAKNEPDVPIFFQSGSFDFPLFVRPAQTEVDTGDNGVRFSATVTGDRRDPSLESISFDPAREIIRAKCAF